MSGYPAALLPLKCFHVRSLEMEPHDKHISYYCSLYALQKSMKIMETQPSPEVTKWVHTKFGELEELKRKIGVLKGKDYFENFVLRVFIGADTEDRKQGSTKETAKKFLVCAQFIEVLNVFNPLEPDWEEKRLYCKWKASDINTAFKEGRTPLPGGPGEQNEPGSHEGIETSDTPQSATSEDAFQSSPQFEETKRPHIPQETRDFSPPVPKPQPQPEPVSVPSACVPPTSQSAGRGVLPTAQRNAIQSSIKFCKNAVSELEFKKVPEAKAWLRQALDALSQFPD